MSNRSTSMIPSRSPRAARVIGMAAMLCAPCVFAPVTWAAEQTVVAPPQYANKEGETRDGDAFNNRRNRIRYQQVFDAPAFQAVSSDIIQITGIRFRLDDGDGSVGSFDVVVPKIEIRLSSSPRDSLHMSETFAENVGSDVTVVYPESPLRLSGQWVGLPPQPFNVEIRFEQSFWYDPRAGHLLLEIFKPGQGALMPDFDQGFDGVSFARGGYDNASATLVQHRVGMVAQFIYTAVPEPSVLTLMVVSGLALLLGKGRK